MIVKVTPFEKFSVSANGILKVNIADITLPPDFSCHEQLFITLPPGAIGGNHRHPRRELLLCLNDAVEFHWLDGNRIKQVRRMREGHRVFLFDVLPFTPHAIINVSEHPASLIELADAPQTQVEVCQIASYDIS